VGRFLKRLAGKLLNAVRAPGFIRSNVCHSRVGVPIEVSVDELFTVVTVNDIRLLFHRLSGSSTASFSPPVTVTVRRAGATMEPQKPRAAVICLSEKR
jgi:hypothetical protein